MALALYLLVPDPAVQYLLEWDALVWVAMAVLTLLLVVYPYLPYLNRLPYYLGIHRLIWREYYHDVRAERDRPVGSSPQVT